MMDVKRKKSLVEYGLREFTSNRDFKDFLKMIWVMDGGF